MFARAGDRQIDESAVDAILGGVEDPTRARREGRRRTRRLMSGKTLTELERRTGWRMARYFRTDDLFKGEAS